MCAVIHIQSQIKPSNWFRLSIALQIGGALGNVTDRIRIGHVTDFIDIGVSSWRWPAFNIAMHQSLPAYVSWCGRFYYGTRIP
ncbi:MAG: hypothetical protein CM1200mP15_20100 [Dehalococcoidia bacterium]|nr:MAG: hypothetical protein CM1200mP15_20100 [Dehalococcoidia bacterium]